AGAAPVELRLDVGLAQLEAGRAAVDDAADRRTVAFAEVGDAKQVAEGAARHALALQREAFYPRARQAPGRCAGNERPVAGGLPAIRPSSTGGALRRPFVDRPVADVGLQH